MLTQELLKQTYSYIPETGKFIRRKATKNRKIGTEAGCLDKSTGYIRISIRINNKDTLYHAHRLAWLYMTGKFPEYQIDHINGNRADNRFQNLRSVGMGENQKNLKVRSDNTTGYLGVSYCKKTNKYYAQAQVKGIHKFLGYFSNITDAISARQEADNLYNFHPNHGKRK